MNIVQKRFNASMDFELQRSQYSEKIPLSGIVPAGASGFPLKSNVSNLGHFKCLRITGRYETLGKYNVTTGAVDASGSICDDGINHIRASLQDSAGQRIMFSDYVPLDLFLSPGRMRSVSAVNNLLKVTNIERCDAAPQLFFPDEYIYTFQANSDILLYCKNDSNADISVDLTFHGVRLLTRVSVSGLK
jgi:hypothetical protein